jgi:hypothetical protein
VAHDAGIMASLPLKTPIVLDMNSHTSGRIPDGRTLPLAWEYTTNKIYMKSYTAMPWGNQSELDGVIARGGVYIGGNDEWFRGVWEEAPQMVMTAEYTRDQLLHPGQPTSLLEASNGDEEASNVDDEEDNDDNGGA